MPIYHCLGIEVQLCTWIPLSRYSSSSHPAQAIAMQRVAQSDVGNKYMSNDDLQNVSNNPKGSWKVAKLDEKFFEDREGLQFLGMNVPFYLSNVSKDILREAPVLSTRANLPTPNGESSTGSVLLSIESSLRRSAQNISSPFSMLKVNVPSQTRSFGSPPNTSLGPSLLVF